MRFLAGSPIKLKGMYLGMRSKALFECGLCGREWESEPRDIKRAKWTGCLECSRRKRRGVNTIMEEDGPFLKIDVSTPSFPGVMLINRKKWEILLRGGIGKISLSSKGYPWATWNKRKEFVHRILMDFPKEVDHINGVKWDNRTHNLREVTATQNQMNRGFRKTNTSGMIGVSWSTRMGKWMAELRVNRKRVHRSYHKSIESAAAARAKAVAEHCGEFAPILAK